MSGAAVSKYRVHFVRQTVKISLPSFSSFHALSQRSIKIHLLVCLSVCPHVTTPELRNGASCYFVLVTSTKICPHIQVFVNIGQT
jgi:hypothetical protein